MANLLGLNAVIYYGPPGVQAPQGAGSTLTNVKDLTLNLEAGEADTTTRAAAGWRSTLATLKDGSVDFEMVWDTTDPGFDFLRTAFFANTLVALLVLDQIGGQGLDADFTIVNFTRTENLEEAITTTVSCKPNAGIRSPVWKI